MLPAGWLVAAVVVAILLTWWVTFTITRLDRLHARVDAAHAAMDAQFVRRAAALARAAESQRAPGSGELAAVAHRALAAPDGEREPAENDVSRAVADLSAATGADPIRAEELRELNESSARAAIARRFYNDAVRDTRALRSRRLPRYLRLSGRRALPQFFDIEDAPQLTASPAIAAPETPAPPPIQVIEQTPRSTGGEAQAQANA
jgi:hypothetical protein